VTPAPIDKHAATPPWRVKLVMTLAAWLVAFATVTTLLSVLGDQLAALPLAVRALVISGVLVTVMTWLVLPALSVAARRRHAGPNQTRSPAAQRSTPTENATARHDAHAAGRLRRR
jgi:antibiotic biosynthesis monooxygenase (ABM) superfamily enzyme